MATSFKEIEQQAQALAAEDRAKLAETLLESLQAPLSEIEMAWAQEIEERVAAFDRGETQAYAAEDVFAGSAAPNSVKCARFVAAARRVSGRSRLLQEGGAGAWRAFRCGRRGNNGPRLGLPACWCARDQKYSASFSQGLSFRCCVSARCRWDHHLCARTSLASAGLLAIACSGPLTNHSCRPATPAAEVNHYDPTSPCRSNQP